jgi:hypothetical protein
MEQIFTNRNFARSRIIIMGNERPMVLKRLKIDSEQAFNSTFGEVQKKTESLMWVNCNCDCAQ